jgi:hypothetical protein
VEHVSLVRIHCYGCSRTVPVEEGAMSHGLQLAGWALAGGETFCPSCAIARKLPVVAAEALDPPGLPQPEGAIDAAVELEPFSRPLSSEPRLQRALRLLGASLRVLREDPELVVFPAVAMALSLAVGVFCFVLSLSSTGTPQHTRGATLVFSLIAGYPITFVSLYCGVALAAVLGGRLNGEPLTTSDGWAAARERVGLIAAWTLMTCTVGAALRLIEQYVPLGAKIVVALVDLSWSLASMFAIPVLAYENLGPVETISRSARIFKQRWGTQIGGGVSIGIGGAVLCVPFAILLAVSLQMPGAGGALLTVLAGIGLFAAIALQTALEQIFRVFVYRSAVGLDTARGPFLQDDLQSPFARRRRSFGRS